MCVRAYTYSTYSISFLSRFMHCVCKTVQWTQRLLRYLTAQILMFPQMNVQEGLLTHCGYLWVSYHPAPDLFIDAWILVEKMWGWIHLSQGRRLTCLQAKYQHTWITSIKFVESVRRNSLFTVLWFWSGEFLWPNWCNDKSSVLFCLNVQSKMQCNL